MEQSTREAYGKTLVELGKQNPDIVVLDADLSKSTMTSLFAREFPRRFFDCGIAEQNMIGIAAGLAATGKTVFVSTFAVFAPGRCFDQIRMSVAQPGLNVKIVATHGGITVGEDGTSHHAIEDLALICSLPGFTVVVPADAAETTQAVKVAAQTYGPFYIRLSRPKTPLVYASDYKFTLGKAATLREGKDITIIATGIMVASAMGAAQSLAQDRIDCRVLSMPTIKPLDRDAIVKAAMETGAIITAEEHLRRGGLGSAVAQIVAEQWPVPMSFVAINDIYAKSGKPAELLKRYRLTAADIESAARSLIVRKHAHI
jgi:transketolase